MLSQNDWKNSLYCIDEVIRILGCLEIHMSTEGHREFKIIQNNWKVLLTGSCKQGQAGFGWRSLNFFNLYRIDMNTVKL